MKKSLIALAVMAAAGATSGCASLDGKLENRVVCTVAKDRAFVVSEFGPVGISSKVAEADRAVICR